MARGVLVSRPGRPRDEAQTTCRTGEAEYRDGLSELSPARSPHGSGKYRPPALLQRYSTPRAAEPGRRYFGSLSDRCKKRFISEPAIRRAAATGRNPPRGHSQAAVVAGRRANRQSSFRSSQGDHGTFPRTQPTRNHDCAGHPLGSERRLRQPDHSAARRLVDKRHGESLTHSTGGGQRILSSFAFPSRRLAVLFLCACRTLVPELASQTTPTGTSGAI